VRRHPDYLSPIGFAVQAKGPIHASPGQRPGFTCAFILLQAIGLRHRVLWVRSTRIPTRRRDGASIPQDNESRFQRSQWSLADEPRALPWAGMNDAFGVSNLLAAPPGWRLSGTNTRLNFRKALGLNAHPPASASACVRVPFHKRRTRRRSTCDSPCCMILPAYNV
jgi:hypothetical protein